MCTQTEKIVWICQWESYTCYFTNLWSLHSCVCSQRSISGSPVLCHLLHEVIFSWQKYVFSNPKTSLFSPALSLGLANDCISFRMLLFLRGHCFGQYLVLFCSGTGLPLCARKQWSKYRAIYTCKPLKAFPIIRHTGNKYKPFPEAILNTE